MTDFIQPIGDALASEPNISAEAIYINGECLETTVDGFRTLSVTGREFIPRQSLDAVISGADGRRYVTSQLGPRPLTVRYQLTATSDADFRAKYNLLNSVLQKGMMQVSFADELAYHFNAVFAQAGDVPHGRNIVQSEFHLYCPDPYKYKPLEVLTGTSIEVGAAYFPYRIDKIEVTFTAESTGFTIQNISTGRALIFTGEFAIDDVLTITPEENVGVKLNGANAMGRLDFASTDWRKFVVNGGDTLTAAESLSVTLSERAL